MIVTFVQNGCSKNVSEIDTTHAQHQKKARKTKCRNKLFQHETKKRVFCCLFWSFIKCRQKIQYHNMFTDKPVYNDHPWDPKK